MPQIEQCQECGDEFPRSKLVRKNRFYGRPAGTNLLLYSSYNSGFWTVDTATDAGRVSMGCFPDGSIESRGYYARPVSGGSTVEERGSQTWTGSGTIRSTTATDASSLTNVCFSAHAGAYHAQTEQSLTVVAGCCASDGSSKVQIDSWTVPGGKLIWWSKTQAELTALSLTSSALYFYITVTMVDATQKWWVDYACVEDATYPSSYRPITRGSAKDHSTPKLDETAPLQLPILCSKCANEILLKPSKRQTDSPRIADWQEIASAEEDL